MEIVRKTNPRSNCEHFIAVDPKWGFLTMCYFWRGRRCEDPSVSFCAYECQSFVERAWNRKENWR